MKAKKEKPKCGGCGETIKEGEPCYQVRSGLIEDGEFARTDLTSQLFHTGKCLNG